MIRNLPGLMIPFRIEKRIYHWHVLDHYENPRNVGSLDKNRGWICRPREIFRMKLCSEKEFVLFL